MMAPTEETLMAFADEALGAAASEAIARYLARDREAASIVLMYRQTAVLLQLAFECPMWEPVTCSQPVAMRRGWWQRLLSTDLGAATRALWWRRDGFSSLIKWKQEP